MNIRFGDQLLNCRQLTTYPSRFKLGDIVLGPNGILLKVVTVQTVPYFEDLNKYKTVVIFETANHEVIPVNGLTGQFNLFRPKVSH